MRAEAALPEVSVTFEKVPLARSLPAYGSVRLRSRARLGLHFSSPVPSANREKGLGRRGPTQARRKGKGCACMRVRVHMCLGASTCM